MTNPDDLLASKQLETDPAEQRAARYRRERDTLRIQLGKLDAAHTETCRLLEFHYTVARANPEPPKWLAPKRTKAGNRATVVAMLSDTHFDEVVNPDEIGGINAYDRTIATMRLKRWAEGVVKLSRDYLAGVTYDGAVVLLGGDIFSGSIHQELAETNEDTSFGSLLYWSEQIAAALEMIRDEFGKVHVAAVVGNHGRMTHKPRSKLRARDNLDWLLAHMLSRQFTGPGITWDIPDSTDAFVTVHTTTHLLTHGDQVSGGGGIAGIWAPIMRMNARKAQRYGPQGRPFDVVCMGHWHQLVMADQQGLIVNGSTKGPDEWGTGTMNFRPERPQQAMWLVTPEHGITMSAPVICADRKGEGW